MPNHWHMVLWPAKDGDMSAFFQWMCATHARRRHQWRGTEGRGAVYQGRFRRVPVETETYFYRVVRYVERNARRAGLAERAEAWPWTSASPVSRMHGIELAPWPLPRPKDWLPINHDTITFGQGLSVNALQMAAAVATVANGGVYVKPSLVEGYVDANGKVTPAPAPEEHRVIKESTARDVARMMEAVTGPDGTAPLANINGYRVAGKTGTAQRVDESCACYDGSFTVSFAGFAPADDPRFVVYVVVQQPKDGNGGGMTGGPVFHDLMAATLQKFGVPPTGTRPARLPVEW